MESRTRPSGTSEDRSFHSSPASTRRARDADEPSFADLEADEMEILAAHGLLRTYRKNTVLMTEHETGGSLHLIRSGRVKVYVAHENGKEYILGVLGPGEFFGELAVVDGGPRVASVVALEQCRISVVSRADFARCLNDYPRIAIAIIRRFADRLRSMTSDVKHLALHDVYGRVSRKLIELSVERNGMRVIDVRPTQREIAAMVGASREMVSRIMKELIAGEYVVIDGRRMMIRRKLPAAW